MKEGSGHKQAWRPPDSHSSLCNGAEAWWVGGEGGERRGKGDPDDQSQTGSALKVPIPDTDLALYPQPWQMAVYQPWETVNGVKQKNT